MNWTRIGALSMALAVCLGAMAAHFLKGELSPESLSSFNTGVRYQLIHSLAILMLSFHAERLHRSNVTLGAMFIGMLLFSGSIYLLSTRTLTGLEGAEVTLGPLTPIGGVLMIISWILLAFHSNKKS